MIRQHLMDQIRLITIRYGHLLLALHLISGKATAIAITDKIPTIS